MTNTLTKKFNALTRKLSLTLEEISAGTKSYGGRIGFASLKNLSHGTGGTNPSGTRVFALAQTLNVPVRYLIDDTTDTPYQAVLADVELLSKSDKKKLISSLAS